MEDKFERHWNINKGYYIDHPTRFKTCAMMAWDRALELVLEIIEKDGVDNLTDKIISNKVIE